ncbi:C1QL [Mytilus coruscus]|uniref:C1QL n=1 Tax=Mytilus coruscus TaxID=42192 RepID=A0A6J8CLC1_MYTCO|nr:C1QL [Mytilus coruscus]
MYSFVITMWIVLMCFILLETARGFLLDPDHTANPAGKNQCLPLGRYLSEKEDLLHHIDQLQRDNEQKLDILTSQLQSRLLVFEEKISENDRKNETLELVNIKRKFQELGVNHTLLQQENKLLRDKYSYQESEMKRLQNTTVELSKKVSDLEQLKSINQSLNLRAIQNKVQSLEQKSNLLTNNQNARNQDFLALYNMTQVADKNVNELQHMFENEFRRIVTTFNETVIKEHMKIINNVTNSFQTMKTSQNTTSFQLQNAFSKIKTMEDTVANNSRTVVEALSMKRDSVAFSAYRIDSQTLSSNEKNFKFDKIWTNVGNAYDPGTGIFTAPQLGVYHFSAVALSVSEEILYICFIHNTAKKPASWVTGRGYKTGTLDVVLNLQKGDEISVGGSSIYTIYSDFNKYATFSGYLIS